MSCDPNWPTRREALALAGGLAAMGMMIPENPVVGGTVLRRAAIQSPNFATGLTGWAIRQDGSAEFNNVVIRNGQIVSGSALFYSGVPAAGNLVTSISAAAGTDAFGNAYVAGITAYTTFDAVGMLGNEFIWYKGSAPGPWTVQGDMALNGAGTQLQIEGFSAGVNVVNELFAAGGEQVSLSSNTIPVLDILSLLGGAAPAAVRITSQAQGDTGLAFRVSGDTTPRLQVATGAAGLVQLLLGPGNAAADITIRRLAANSLGILTADLAVDTVGRGLQVKEGTNAKQGTAVLVAGSVVVANTSVTANSRIFLTCQVPGGTPGFLRISARTAGTSFTITSSSGTDTSTVAYEIFEPAP